MEMTPANIAPAYDITRDGRKNAYLALGYRRDAYRKAKAATAHNAILLAKDPAAADALPYGHAGRTRYVPEWRKPYYNGTGLSTWGFNAQEEYAGTMHISGEEMTGDYSEAIPLPAHMEIESVGRENGRRGSTGYCGDEYGDSIYAPVVVRIRVGKKIALANRSPRASGILEEGERYLYAAGFVVAGESTGLVKIGRGDWEADKEEANKSAHHLAEKAAEENREAEEKYREEREEEEHIEGLHADYTGAHKQRVELVNGAKGRVFSPFERKAFDAAGERMIEAGEALEKAGATIPEIPPAVEAELLPFVEA